MKNEPIMCMKTRVQLTKCQAANPRFGTKTCRLGDQSGRMLDLTEI